MLNNELHHPPFIISRDSDNNLYIKDDEEGLTFIREEAGNGLYDITVIIECEHNWRPNTWTIALDEPFGIVLEEITHPEWRRLVREYLSNRYSEKLFQEFLERKLYSSIYYHLNEVEFIAESMPCPNAPEDMWVDYNKSRESWLKKN